VDQATAFKLLTTNEQDGVISTTASSEFSFLAALLPSCDGLSSAHMAIPAHTNTVLIDNTSKKFFRSYLKCYMSFSVQMCKTKQGEL